MICNLIISIKYIVITRHCDLIVCRVLLDSNNSKAFRGDKINQLKNNNNYVDGEPKPRGNGVLGKILIRIRPQVLPHLHALERDQNIHDDNAYAILLLSHSCLINMIHPPLRPTGG